VIERVTLDLGEDLAGGVVEVEETRAVVHDVDG
jgi:hypothetical protein